MNAGDGNKTQFSHLWRHFAARAVRALPSKYCDWRMLERELKQWKDGSAHFWWRDDDAFQYTPELGELLELRKELDLPLAVSVIPFQAEESLVSPLDQPGIWVLQHGGDHRNHSPAKRPAGEFVEGRSPAEVQAQLERGRERLETMFGERFLPVLVPPFGRLAKELLPSVHASGLRRVSLGVGPRPGLWQTWEVHLDVVDWTAMSAVSVSKLVRRCVVALRLRRLGVIRREAPIGVLTHHGSHSREAWALTRELLTRLAESPAVSFRSPPELFSAR